MFRAEMLWLEEQLVRVTVFSISELIPVEGEPHTLAEDFQSLMTGVSLAHVGPFLRS